MTKLLAICILLVTLCSARGQEQERGLVDRIMKPDMTLQSAEQKKKFKADRSSIDRHATVGTFYVPEKRKQKPFYETPQFSSEKVNPQTFNSGTGDPTYSAHQKSAIGKSYSLATNTPQLKSAYDGNKTQAARDYSGKRPYLEKGKSQKSLDRKNKPMTIEQVRELLNKNK